MIYFVQTHDKKYIKIGYSRTSRSAKQRLHQLQVKQSKNLKMLKIIYGSRITERYIHNLFWHICKLGEWFWTTEELLNFIDNPEIPKILNKCRSCGYVWSSQIEREAGCPKCDTSEWWLKRKRKSRIVPEYIRPFEYIINKEKYEKLIYNREETIKIPRIKTNNLLKNGESFKIPQNT